MGPSWAVESVDHVTHSTIKFLAMASLQSLPICSAPNEIPRTCEQIIQVPTEPIQTELVCLSDKQETHYARFEWISKQQQLTPMRCLEIACSTRRR